VEIHQWHCPPEDRVHARSFCLQRNLVNWIKQNTDRYEAIQELRCIIFPISPVPDIAVIEIVRLPQADGPFEGAPDWVIEIR
jgi:Uma2 family endonuclease